MTSTPACVGRRAAPDGTQQLPRLQRRLGRCETVRVVQRGRERLRAAGRRGRVPEVHGLHLRGAGACVSVRGGRMRDAGGAVWPRQQGAAPRPLLRWSQEISCSRGLHVVRACQCWCWV